MMQKGELPTTTKAAQAFAQMFGEDAAYLQQARTRTGEFLRAMPETEWARGARTVREEGLLMNVSRIQVGGMEVHQHFAGPDGRNVLADGRPRGPGE
jgi:hypothetical protein